MTQRTDTSATPSKPNKHPPHGLPHSIYTDPPKVSLPLDGMSRWKQFQQFSPFSREKYRQLSIAGKAPQPIKLSQRCTCYSNRELHRFFADPLNYSVEVK
jgi:hypothetical protein